MAGAVTLSKFNPSKRAQAPHKEMDAGGRYTFKGVRMASHLRQPRKRREKPRTEKPTKFPLYPSDLDGTLSNSNLIGSKLGFTHKYKLKDLVVAIKEIEDERAISPGEMGATSLLEHFVRRAFKSDSVLKDMMKKLLPDLKHVDADIDVTEQFQLIIDATGDDEDDDIVDVKALPAPNVSNNPKRRNVKIKRRRKRAWARKT